MRYLAGALRANGDEARVVAFDRPEEISQVAEEVARHDVDVIGLSMMFQLRAREIAARWHATAGAIVPGDDPLAVEVRSGPAGASAVCIMELADGLCIATWNHA